MCRWNTVTLAVCLVALLAACGEDKEEAPFELPATGGRTIGDDTNPNNPNNSDVDILEDDTNPSNDNRCAPADIYGGQGESFAQPTANCGDSFAGAGLYKAGVRTLELDGKLIEMWYPVRQTSVAGSEKAVYDMREWLPQELGQRIPDTACTRLEMNAYRDLPIADGPFPLVVFSHGLAGYRMQSSAIMSHLASWGFVVAAPEHAERGLAIILETGAPSGDDAPVALSQTLDMLESMNETDATFQGRFDLNMIAAAGHSMGSAATASVGQEDRVDAWITLAGAGFGDGPLKPLLMMGGTNDGLATPDVLDDSYDRQPTSVKRFVSVQDAGHLGFTDICLVGRSQGGVLEIAQNYGLEIAEVLLTLANDGCQEDALPAEEVFPVVNHYMVAHLRASLGIDSVLRGFDDNTRECFGSRVADIRLLGNDDAVLEEEQLEPLGGNTPEPTITPAGPGLVCCGDSGGVCNLNNSFCCSTWIGMACQPQCSVFALTQTCDGNEDCPNQKCCRQDDANAPAGIVSFGSTCRDTCEAGETELTTGVDMCVSGVGTPPLNPNPNGNGGMSSQPSDAPAESNQVPGVADEVICGDISCDVTTSVCCVGLNGSECLAGSTCAGFSAPQACDGPEDCASGSICCVGFPSGASCVSDGQCPSGQNELCHVNGDCRGSDSCLSCNPPGSPDPVSLCGTSCPF